MNAPAPAAEPRRNPFPGLRPFRDDEEHLFFGRENQVNTMVDKLAATRFLAVVGTSGSGKSSLVNCGLRPALHRGLMAKAGTAWRIAQFRPGTNPLRAMSDALAQDGVLFTNFESNGAPLRDIVEANLQMSKLGLVDLYQQAPFDESVNLLVVVDQFEELFRYRSLGGPLVAQALLPNTAKRLDSLHHWVSFAVLPVVETLRFGNEQGRGQISLGGEGRRLRRRGSRD